MLISKLEVCQEGGSRRGYLEDVGGFLTGDMEERVIPDVMNDVLLPQGRYDAERSEPVHDVFFLRKKQLFN